MSASEKPIQFRGSMLFSAVPLATFLGCTIVFLVLGAVSDVGMIMFAMAGISLGMAFCTDMAGYCERVFSLMANRVATVAIVCWLWAGTFSGILADSGLVESMVWVGWKLGLSGGAFTVVVFISSALFAVSVGTGLGTVVGFTAVMYPAGVVLGADPAALMGAIISGGAFGDNLAPISDTTIVSAATQETDVGGVVKSRLKYALIAGTLSAVLFYVFGEGNSTMDADEAQRIMAETADPKGLPMLIPAVIVFVVAVGGGHFLAALTCGIISAAFLGPLLGIFPLESLFYITEEGSFAGSAVDGAMGLVPTAILTLLLVTTIGIMSDGGFLESLLAWLDRTFARTVRGAEGVIIALISFANICVSVNTVAMITVGPMVNKFRKRHGIHPHRAANLMDTVSCSFPYILPYSAIITAAGAVQQQVAARYDFTPIVPWAQEALFMFYGLTLFPIMIIAAVTGYGRKSG